MTTNDRFHAAILVLTVALFATVGLEARWLAGASAARLPDCRHEVPADGANPVSRDCSPAITARVVAALSNR